MHTYAAGIVSPVSDRASLFPPHSLIYASAENQLRSPPPVLACPTPRALVRDNIREPRSSTPAVCPRLLLPPRALPSAGTRCVLSLAPALFVLTALRSLPAWFIATRLACPVESGSWCVLPLSNAPRPSTDPCVLQKCDAARPHCGTCVKWVRSR